MKSNSPTAPLGLALTLGLLLTASPMAIAQDVRSMEEVCAGVVASPEARVDACGWLIETAAYTDLSDYALAHLRRGRALSSLKQLDEATADFDTALEYDPYLYAAYIARGDTLLAAGEYYRAIADFSVAAGLEPLSAEPYAKRGLALFAHREYAEAAADLDSALGYDATHSQARKTLAWILATAPDRTQRDGARALSLIQASAADGAPDRMILAAALAETGAKDEAVDLYKAIAGSSDTATRRFQSYLGAAGFYDGAEDGFWSPELENALRACLSDGCRVGAPRPRS